MGGAVPRGAAPASKVEELNMFITRKHLSRRTVLKGGAATIALPLLQSMVPAATANALDAVQPTRMHFSYIPHGVIRGRNIPAEGLARGNPAAGATDRWTPNGVGSNFELVGDLASLSPFQSHVTVVTNLSNQWAAQNTPHGVHMGTWLQGTAPVVGRRVYEDRISIDQRFVEIHGRSTPLPSLALAGEPGGTLDNRFGWGFGMALSHSREMPLMPTYNPRDVFFQLFGRGATPEERERIKQQNASLLDSVGLELAALARRLPQADQTAIDQFLGSVREVERRIQLAEAAGLDQLDLPATPAGVPAYAEDQLALQYDLIALAFQADITRAATFATGREVSMRTFPTVAANAATGMPARGLNITSSWHPLSHSGGNSVAQRSSIVNMFTKQYANHLIARLANTPEGDGTLLDRVISVWGSGMGDGSNHDFVDLPTVVVGRGNGAVRGGQHLIMPSNTPLNNLWLTLLNRTGANLSHFGDGTSEIVEV